MDTTLRDMFIKTYNLENATPEEQDALVEKIGGLVFQAVILRVAPGMSEQAQDKLESLLSTNTAPDELLAFMNSEVPNFEAIVAEEAAGLKAERDAIMSQVG